MGMLNNSPSAITTNLPPTGPVPAIPNVTFVPASNDPDHRRESNFISSLISFNQRLGSQANLRLGYGAMLSNRADINGPAGGGFQSPYRSVSEFNGRIDTAQARVDWTPLRSNAITAGYEWEREFYANPSFDENPDPSIRVNTDTRVAQRSSAIFVQDQIRLFRERLFVSPRRALSTLPTGSTAVHRRIASLQRRRSHKSARCLTGDASLAWLNPGTGTKFRAHVGNAYRVPSLYERFGSYFFLGSFTALGDPRLRPERSLGVDGGIDQYFASTALRLSATYFYTRLQEVIAYGNLSNDPFGRFSGYVNVGGGLARGVELSGEARPWRGMTMQASYTYTNADERQSIMTDGSLRGIRYYPNAFTFLAMQQLGRRTNVTFDFLGASDYVSGSFFVGGGSRPYLFSRPSPRQRCCQLHPAA
jgi:iron complex outermembrane receptor protein